MIKTVPKLNKYRAGDERKNSCCAPLTSLPWQRHCIHVKLLPVYAAMDCKYTKAGHFYAGPLSVTRSGKTCQRWDSDQYHKSNYKSEAYYFPEGSASAAGNKCRNPASDYYDGVWCYTTDPGTTWEQCDVEFCGT